MCWGLGQVILVKVDEHICGSKVCMHPASVVCTSHHLQQEASHVVQVLFSNQMPSLEALLQVHRTRIHCRNSIASDVLEEIPVENFRKPWHALQVLEHKLFLGHPTARTLPVRNLDQYTTLVLQR